ncbi:MAG: hypothetical protein WBL53_10345, partial [Pseudonocardiaceae bacterium]
LKTGSTTNSTKTPTNTPGKNPHPTPSPGPDTTPYPTPPAPADPALTDRRRALPVRFGQHGAAVRQRVYDEYTGVGVTQSLTRNRYALGEAAIWIEGSLESAVRTALEVN